MGVPEYYLTTALHCKGQQRAGKQGRTIVVNKQAPSSPQDGIEGIVVASHVKYGFFRQAACSLEALNHASVCLSASNALVS